MGDKVGGSDRAAVGTEEAVVKEILQGHISPVGDGLVEGHQDNLQNGAITDMDVSLPLCMM